MRDDCSPRDAAALNSRAAVEELGRIPRGQVAVDIVAARSAQATALATIGLLQAVLHVGDTLAAARLSAPGTPVDLIDVTTHADASPQYILGEGAAEALLAMGWTPPAEGGR
ncbi:hypothetical protein [Kitasatospora cineracea]|uniref:Uncharacterized protein n=1 Tax=Kitasatospora cineracea TaxID=88074 RepID=A0A3N4R8K2_9ACTN|nr:hypothetical protein [Kitasatospora cineracea]RPE27295.1 hypothetical protein EDD38_7440 [Kitasatospora cineracea]